MPGGSGASGESPKRTVSRMTGGKYITKAGKVSKVHRANKRDRKKLMTKVSRKVAKVNKTKRAMVRMAREKIYE